MIFPVRNRAAVFYWIFCDRSALYVYLRFNEKKYIKASMDFYALSTIHLSQVLGTDWSFYWSDSRPIKVALFIFIAVDHLE